MTRNRTIAVIAAVVLLGAVGLYVAYDQVLRGDDVAPLALPSTEPVATDVAVASDDPVATDPAASEAVASADTGTGTDGSVDGTWTIATGSEAGYRVREQLANLPAECDAVGRTTDVTGDDHDRRGRRRRAGDRRRRSRSTPRPSPRTSRRDNRMRSEGLQTEQFPTATFIITQPVDVPAAAFAGTATDVTLVAAT